MTPPNTSPAVPADSAKPPLVGVIYNRHSHRNQGLDHDSLDRPNILVAQPKDRDDLPSVLADFAARGIDYLVINGGDGTVRDVLTRGLPVWGENWPAIAVLPKGKTNALNVDLGAPSDWTLAGAVAAFSDGKRIVRQALSITPVEGDAAPLLGFILGAGALTTGIKAGQDAHRLGAFNSLAVGVTTVWGALQAVFGSDKNPWRRGVGMRLLLGPEREELAHSGVGDTGRRGLLFSSTLEAFPVGMKPFGKYRTGLKMIVLDKTRRRILAMMPGIVAGYVPEWVQRAGLHIARCEFYEMAVEDDFILDGEAFPPGTYRIGKGPELHFVTP